MPALTIPPAVSAARSALEALADRLRRGADASLETADACTALRALAAAWAAVLPRLAEDVTPPEWPKRREGERRGPCPPDGFAALLDLWISAAARSEEVDDRMADILDAYADGLRAWGREAAACEEETIGECPRCGEPCPVGADRIRAILSTIDDPDVTDAIATTAEACARELRAQGWQGDGSAYALEAYPGDLQALEDVLDRDGRFQTRSTSHERRALEACIRAYLDASKEG